MVVAEVGGVISTSIYSFNLEMDITYVRTKGESLGFSAASLKAPVSSIN